MFRIEFVRFFFFKINERNVYFNVFIDLVLVKNIYIKGCENVVDCKRLCSGYCLNNDFCNLINGFCIGGCVLGYLGMFCN